MGDQVSAYVDRCLDPMAMREIDRHLVACQVCRHEVDQESRLLRSLRHGSTPRVSATLQASLLSLASGDELVLDARGSAARVASLPTVSPTRPALHRSPRRAAGLAGFAATASAAAAFGLAVAGPGATAAPLRVPSPRPVDSVSEAVSATSEGPEGRSGSGSSAMTVAAGLTSFSRSSAGTTVRPVTAISWTTRLLPGR